MDSIFEQVEEFRKQLAAGSLKAEARLIEAYRHLYEVVEARIDALLLATMESGTLTEAQLVRMERYKALMNTVRRELEKYRAFSEVEMNIAARKALDLGEIHGRMMVALSAGNVTLSGQMNALNPKVIEQLLGFLQPEGALYKRLAMMPDVTVSEVSKAIIEGIGMGSGPKVTAGVLSKLGMALTDSLRMMRTVQLYSYREANRASYIANSDVVREWIWYADLAGACPACVAMHGTRHPLSERLNDHHNGRCAMVPVTITNPKINIETGEEWFEKQTETRQQQILGKGKFEAYQSGKFKFEQLATNHTDEVYGEMRTEASLKELLVER